MRRAALGLALAALAGCAVLDESAPEIGIVADALSTRLGGEEPAAAAPAPSRAALAGFTEPLLYARIPARGSNALLGVAETNGAARTWATAQDISLTLRGGVLVATRGLGEDLISAAVPAIRAATTATRRHDYLDGNDQTVEITFGCRIEAAGAEQVTVLERAYTTRRLDETCESRSGREIRNSYWIDAGGLIRQSRQWVSPSVGYITLQRIVA